MISELSDAGFVGLVDQQVFLPLALLLAVGLGAAHACAPGHGKTLAAAYLVGGRARPRDALLLGLTVAAMHTVSVVLLGVGWYVLAGAAPDVGALTRWLQLAAALLVVGVGAVLLRRHLRGRVAPGQHHAHHDHGHGHGHGHGDGHEPGSLLTRRGLVTLGTSGGLLPSPAAFLVLITGLFTGQALSAALLVAAFGVGMALTLGGVGWAVLRGRDGLLRRMAGPRTQLWAMRLPLVAAVGVLAGGTVLAGLATARLVVA